MDQSIIEKLKKYGLNDDAIADITGDTSIDDAIDVLKGAAGDIAKVEAELSVARAMQDDVFDQLNDLRVGLAQLSNGFGKMTAVLEGSVEVQKGLKTKVEQMERSEASFAAVNTEKMPPARFRPLPTDTAKTGATVAKGVVLDALVAKLRKEQDPSLAADIGSAISMIEAGADHMTYAVKHGIVA